jgi:hypothetical protein
MKRTMKRLVLLSALILAGATGTFAQFTVGGGFALSATDVSVSGLASTFGANPKVESDAGFGGTLYLDYLLPVGIPVSVGAELSVLSAKFKTDAAYLGTFKDTVTAVPLLIRVAYHFDFVPILDLYVVGKIGGAFGSWEGSFKSEATKLALAIDDPGGFAIGIDVGAAYYFTSMFGVFAELGVDHYGLEAGAFGSGISATLEAPFTRFLVFGANLKF